MQGYHNDSRSYEVSTWEVFGELYYQVTDQLKATVDLRYSDEQKEGVQRTLYVTFLDLPNEPTMVISTIPPMKIARRAGNST